MAVRDVMTIHYGTGKFGTSSDYAEVTKEGVEMKGGSTRWEDLRVAADQTRKGASKIPNYGKLKDNGSGSQGVFCHWFDATAEEELYFSVQIPHSWVEGSSIYPHVHWVTAHDLGTTKVVWGLEYTESSITGSFGNTTILTAKDCLGACVGTAGEHLVTPFTSISMTGSKVSSMLICRIFRDATSGDDDFTHDAGLLEIDFHYEVNTPGGSRTEWSK